MMNFKYPSVSQIYDDIVDKCICDDVMYHVTEKIHGTHIAIGVEGDKISVYSRNNLLAEFNRHEDIPEINFYDISEVLKRDNIALKLTVDGMYHGELYGPGIQKMNYGPEKKIAFFDIMTPQSYFLNVQEAFELLDYLGLETPPVINGSCTLDEAFNLPEEFQSRIGDCQAEGLVIRPRKESYVGMTRVIFKNKGQKFSEVKKTKSTDLDDYITQERIQNMYSRDPGQSLIQLTNAVVDDIVTEYSKYNNMKRDKVIQLIKRKVFLQCRDFMK